MEEVREQELAARNRPIADQLDQKDRRPGTLEGVRLLVEEQEPARWHCCHQNGGAEDGP